MFYKVYRKSQLTGNINVMELPISDEDIKLRKCKTDSDLRCEFQFLNFSERQFLLSGITLDEMIKCQRLTN